MNEERHLSRSVVVGRVHRPHGVRGEVFAEALSDVDGRFDVGQQLQVRRTDEQMHDVRIASARAHGDGLLLGFEEYSSRDEVEPLRGALLEVTRDRVPPAPEGSFYHYELLGCGVRDRQAGDLGRVIDVVEDGGSWLLEVERQAGHLLVPFVAAYLDRVDVENRQIEVNLPEGLIELCTSTS